MTKLLSCRTYKEQRHQREIQKLKRPYKYACDRVVDHTAVSRTKLNSMDAAISWLNACLVKDSNALLFINATPFTQPAGTKELSQRLQILLQPTVPKHTLR